MDRAERQQLRVRLGRTQGSNLATSGYLDGPTVGCPAEVTASMKKRTEMKEMLSDLEDWIFAGLI